MKHIAEEDLVFLYYNEPGVPDGFRRHLAECEDCSARAQSLARTLELCDDWQPPQLDADFGRGVWNLIAPQLEPPSAVRLRWWKPAIALFAMAALILAAYVAGRASKPAPPTVLTGLSSQARERILAISLADHLERAQILLTEIANSNDREPVRLSAARANAQDLVEEGRLLRQTMTREGLESRTADTDEIERILLEIANAPDKSAGSELESLRQRIATGSLLFKARILEANLRIEGKRT